MLTVSQLKRLIEQAHADEATLRSQANLVAEQRAHLEKMLERAERALTSQHEPNTVGEVNTALSSNALRSQKQMADGARNHRLVLAMEKKGLSFADVADALGGKLGRPVPRSTVQSWVKPKSDVAYRAIPAPAADALKALYSVPLNAWPRIIPS